MYKVSLAEQDLFTNIDFDYPKLIKILPCQFNAQMSIQVPFCFQQRSNSTNLLSVCPKYHGNQLCILFFHPSCKKYITAFHMTCKVWANNQVQFIKKLIFYHILFQYMYDDLKSVFPHYHDCDSWDKIKIFHINGCGPTLSLCLGEVSFIIG